MVGPVSSRVPISSNTPEFALHLLGVTVKKESPLPAHELAAIEGVVNGALEHIEKLPPISHIENRVNQIKTKAEEINRKIWTNASFIEKAKWYISKILGSWSPCTSRIQFLNTSRIVEHVKLSNYQKKLQKFLKESDATIMMRGERRGIQERLAGLPAGTCAIIAAPKEKSGKETSGTFVLFMVNSNGAIQEIPLQLKGAKVHAEIEDGSEAFTTIQELVSRVCAPGTSPMSLVAREAKLEALKANVKDAFAAFCGGKKVYPNEAGAKAAIQTIHEDFPVCQRISTSAIYKNREGEYGVLMWDPRNKQFSKVTLDFTTSPGDILFRLDDQRHPLILKRCSASEVANFFLKECGRDVAQLSSQAQQFQAHDDFRAYFQGQMFTAHELLPEGGNLHLVRTRVDEKFRKICRTSSYLLRASAERDHLDRASFILFTHQPASRFPWKNAETVMQKVIIETTGRIQIQEITDTERLKASSKPQFFASNKEFSEYLSRTYKSSLKEQITQKLDPLLEKLEGHEETFRGIVSEIVTSGPDYDVGALTATKKALEKLKATLQKDCDASGTLWKAPDLVKKIDLEISTQELRLKIATAWKTFKKVTKAPHLKYAALEQAKVDMMKVLVPTGNPAVSAMSKEERLGIYRACEDLYKDASLILLPDYVQEEVPKLLTQAEESLNSTNVGDIAKQKQAVESVIGMLKALEKYFLQDANEAIAHFKEKREALEKLLPELTARIGELKQKTTGGGIHLSHIQTTAPIVAGIGNNVTIKNYYGSQGMGGQPGVAANSVAAIAQRILNPMSIGMVVAQAAVVGTSLPLALGTYVASSVVAEGVRYVQPTLDPRFMQMVTPLLLMGGSIVYNRIMASTPAVEAAAPAPQAAPAATTRVPLQPRTSIQPNPFHNIREPSYPTITSVSAMPASAAHAPQVPFQPEVVATQASAEAIFFRSVWDYVPSMQQVNSAVQIGVGLAQLASAAPRAYMGDLTAIPSALASAGVLFSAARASNVAEQEFADQVSNLPAPPSAVDADLARRLIEL